MTNRKEFTTRETMKRLFLFLILFCGASFSQDTKAGTITTAGSDCTVATSCVSLGLANSSGAVGLSLSGTFTATVQFEVSADNGTTWVAASGTPPGSTSTATSATAAGTWRFAVSGLTNFRVRGSAYTSGTINVSIQSSQTSASLGGSGGGFTPPVVATQSANGATMETCKRFTDSAPTGNCWLALSNDGLTTLFKVDVGGNIWSNTLKDLNGNPFLIISATASAVDSITITNAATANPAVVSLGATGSDSNISLRLAPKGTGTINLDNQVSIYGKKTNGSLYPVLGVNSSDQVQIGGSNQIDVVCAALTPKRSRRYRSIFTFSGSAPEYSTLVGQGPQ